MRGYRLVLALAALAACSEGADTTRSGEIKTADEAPLPSTDLGNTYPSQTGQQTTVAPGAEGGRGSAATGASDQGVSGTNTTDDNQASPPPS